jgi:APA family basic amino acid/polyamine antiporter
MISSSRKIGFFTVLALVIGNTVGNGIFLIPSSLARFGSISLIGWIFTSLGVITIAMSYARLSRMHPAVGGPYAYCRKGFGDYIGFQVAWNYWIATWTSNAGVVVGLIGYLSICYEPIGSSPVLSFILSTTILWLITLLNIMSLKKAGNLQVITTVLKLLPLFALLFFGIGHIHTENFVPFNTSGESNLAAIVGVATITMWAFAGFETGTVPAGNIINPDKTIPRATIIGTLVTMGIYIGISTIVLGIIPNCDLINNTAPIAYVGEIVFGTWGKWVITIGAIISSIGTLNGLVLVQAKIPYAAAKDKLFPESFAKTTKEGEPIIAHIVSSLLITGLLIMGFNDKLVDKYTYIIIFSSLTTLITYLFSVVSEVMLYIQDKNTKKLPKGHIFNAFLAFIYIFWAFYGAGTKQIYAGCLLFFISTPIYAYLKYRNP